MRLGARRGSKVQIPGSQKKRQKPLHVSLSGIDSGRRSLPTPLAYRVTLVAALEGPLLLLEDAVSTDDAGLPGWRLHANRPRHRRRLLLLLLLLLLLCRVHRVPRSRLLWSVRPAS